MPNQPTISKAVAKQFACCIAGEITSYVSNHLDEYRIFLAKNGYVDNTIFENNSEAESEQRKCG